MELVELLERDREAILDEATETLERRRLPPYEAAGEARNRERMARLHELTVACLRDRSLVPMVEHAEAVARERHDQGFNVGQVNAGFNVFEEVLWRQISETMDPADYPDAFGSVATILGAGKEALAVEYVSLASTRRVGSLDMSELFRGG